MNHGMLPRLIVPVAAALALQSAAATCWQGDASGGELAFSGEIEGEAFFGTFGEFDVEVCQQQEGSWEDSDWVVRVATGSADTRNRDRDETLHGGEFFAVDRFPEAVWRSTNVVNNSTSETTPEGVDLLLEGNLELRSNSAPQEVKARLEPRQDGLLLTGSADISRMRFDVGQGEFSDTEFIRDRVDLEFEIQLAPK